MLTLALNTDDSKRNPTRKNKPDAAQCLILKDDISSFAANQ
jgi:hypothetical protein